MIHFIILLSIVVLTPVIILGLEQEYPDGRLKVLIFILIAVFSISIQCLFSLWAEREKEIELQKLIILDYIEKEERNDYSID